MFRFDHLLEDEKRIYKPRIYFCPEYRRYLGQLIEIKTDLNSAQPELDQLAKNLVQVEDNLFPNL